MKHGPPLHRFLLGFALAGMLGLAHATEHGDISQLLREGKLAEAQTRVDRLLAAKPRDPQLRLYKGVIQRETGRTNEALATFSKLSEDHPELPEPYNNLAVIYAAQGQYDKAGYKEPPEAYGAFAFAAMQLVLDKIEQVGPDRRKVTAALGNVNNYDSIVGPITFDDHGQNTVPLISKYVAQDGKWAIWEDSEYAGGKRKLRK